MERSGGQFGAASHDLRHAGERTHLPLHFVGGGLQPERGGFLLTLWRRRVHRARVLRRAVVPIRNGAGSAVRADRLLRALGLRHTERGRCGRYVRAGAGHRHLQDRLWPHVCLRGRRRGRSPDHRHLRSGESGDRGHVRHGRGRARHRGVRLCLGNGWDDGGLGASSRADIHADARACRDAHASDDQSGRAERAVARPRVAERGSSAAQSPAVATGLGGGCTEREPANPGGGRVDHMHRMGPERGDCYQFQLLPVDPRGSRAQRLWRQYWPAQQRSGAQPDARPVYLNPGEHPTVRRGQRSRFLRLRGPDLPPR